MLKKVHDALPDHCLSDLTLDEWRSGDLAGEPSRALEAHLETCARCRERDQALRQQSREFLERFPKLRELPQMSRLNVRSFGWTGAVLAAAAAFFLFLRPASVSVGPTVRLKGSAHFDFFVKRGAAVVRGDEKTLLRPGDQLRFVVTTTETQHVAILSLDAAGVASIYHADQGRGEALGVVRELSLESSVELDSTLGEEQLWAVFCPEPFEVEPLRLELESRGTLDEVPGCSLESLRIFKEPSP